MWPNPADCKGYGYPENGLLQIYDSVPESEMIMPTQLNAHGECAMPVVKNGCTTGTTVGWLNGLKSKVHYYRCEGDTKIDFKSLETTFIPYDAGYDVFSDRGDSGSIILDRYGRIVAILTGGGGITNSTDVTFGTPWYQLFPQIKVVLPSCFVL